jgi:hypothetical protein
MLSTLSRELHYDYEQLTEKGEERDFEETN